MSDKNTYTVIDELTDAHKNQLLDLYRQAWWSKDRSRQDLETIIAGSSFMIGIVQNTNDQLIGFTRVLTDNYKYAYVYDVIVSHEHRGHGLGDLLLRNIVNHPKLASIRNIELTCADEMVPFYGRYDFSKDYGAAVPLRRTNKESTAS
jgi:ribosomal protein S18 acetylase RimI-like enzyme